MHRFGKRPMTEAIDSQEMGLSARDRVERLADAHWALVVDRRSRIVMADGRRILEKAKKIHWTIPGVKVSLKTNAPVCSKTRAFLAEHGVNVVALT